MGATRPFVAASHECRLSGTNQNLPTHLGDQGA